MPDQKQGICFLVDSGWFPHRGLFMTAHYIIGLLPVAPCSDKATRLDTV